MSLITLYITSAILILAGFLIGYTFGLKKCDTRTEAVLCGILGVAMAIIFVIVMSDILGRHTSWFAYA